MQNTSVKTDLSLHPPDKYSKRAHSIRELPTHPLNRDVLRYDLGPNTHIEVCWKKGVFGIGPSASFRIYDYRIFKFDCFGDGGHFHVYCSFRHEPANINERIEDKGRLYFPGKSIEEQIDRACFELIENIDYYLLRDPVLKVRRFKTNRSELLRGAEWMKQKMMAYYHTVPELKALHWFKNSNASKL